MRRHLMGMEQFRDGYRESHTRGLTPTARQGLSSGLAFVLVIAAFAIPCGAAERPNVVLILADDLGYGDVGCYNPDAQISTPAIDALAKAGTRFTDAHAPASVCVPTRYALLTGRYPFRRPKGNGSYNAGPLIEKDVPTLPGMLRSQGYRTAMVGKWHLGFDFDGFEKPMPGGPVDRGFESYFGVPASTDIPPYFFIEQDRAVAAPTGTIAGNTSSDVRRIQGAFWRKGRIAPGLSLEEVLPKLADRAEGRLGEMASADDPFFLYLAFTAPHTPWVPSERFQGRSNIGGENVPEALGDYGDFVTQVDSVVGRLTARLEKQGIADETIVIFSSDNGPVWYDKNVRTTGHDSAGPLRGMKGDAWEAGHRMPFIVHWPGHVPEGRVCEELVCQVDLMGTLTGMLGHSLPAEAAPDSRNLWPLFSGKSDACGRETLVTQASSGTLALRKGRFKYIPQLGSAGFSNPRRRKPKPNRPSVQLYDLEADLGERRNLAAERPEMAESMGALLEEIKASQRTVRAR